MFISFFSLVSILVAVFLFSLWRPKMAIFLPIIFHLSFLVKTRFFFIPSTGLEVLIVGVLAGVWAGAFLQAIRRYKRQRYLSHLETGCLKAAHPREGGDLGEKKRALLKQETRFPHARGWYECVFFSNRYLFTIIALISLFIISSTVSAIIAPHFDTAWGAWKAFIIEPILYAITLIYFVKKYNLWSRLIASLLAGGMLSCLFSLVFWRFGADFWRFRGIYDVPNSLALLLAPLLVVAVLVFSTHFHYESFLQKQESVIFRYKKWFLSIAVCIFGVLLLATQSIAGVVSVAAAFLLIYFLKKRFNRRVVAGVLIIILLAIGTQFYSGKIPHLLNQTSSSLVAREQIWIVSGVLVKDNVLFGTGLGTFEPAYQEKLKTLNPNFGSSGILEWVVRDPHNIFLSFWLNTGLLGLLSMILLVVIGIKRFFWATRPFSNTGSESLSYFPLIRGIKGVWRRIIARTPLRLPLSGERHDASLPRLGRHQAPQARGRGQALIEGEQQIQCRTIIGAALLTLIIFGLFDVPYWKNDLALLWWVYLASAIL
jgi:O-antigen ligase